MDPVVFGGVWAAIKGSEQKAEKSKEKNYPIGHSLVFWLIFGAVFAYIPVIYFTFSKKHKWHL